MEFVDLDEDDVKAFLIESYESIEQIERDIIELEKNANNEEIVTRMYRSLHTIKGNCGFLPFPKLESVAHAAENLLGYLRDRNLVVSPEAIAVLLQTADTIRQILASIEIQNNEGDADYSFLIESLTQLHPEELGSRVKPLEPIPSSNEKNPEVTNVGVSESSIRVDVKLLDRLMNLVGELVLARNQLLELSKQENSTVATTCQHLDSITTQLQEGMMKTRMQPINTIFQKFPRMIRDLAIACGKQVRLEIEGAETELDRSVIEAIKDPLTHIIRNCIDGGIETPAVRLERNKPEQGRLFLKSWYESGKVNIEIGDDGNGIDIERVKQKARQLGLISTSQADAMSESEAINLIFSPGLSTAQQVTNISGRGVGMNVVKNNIEQIDGTVEVYSQLGQGTTFKLKIPLTLAIIPALTVTSGGDRFAIPQATIQELVRLEAEKIDSGIEILYDVPVYRLRGNILPLLYLNRELQLFKVESRWRSPSLGRKSKVESLFEVESRKSKVESLFEVGSSSEVPLALERKGKSDLNSGSAASQPPILPTFDFRLSTSFNIVVIHAEHYRYGLVVDQIEDTQDIVVKPLGKQLRDLSIYAGATILGDGKVALIIDAIALANRAGVNAQIKQLPNKITTQEQKREELQLILLFEGPEGALMGIPLSVASRLEKFPRSAVSKVGDRYVVQYRDTILSLVDLHRAFCEDDCTPLNEPMTTNEEDTLEIVVVSLDRKHSIGLVLDRIIDIVEDSLAVKGIASRPGVLFYANIQGQVIEMLDLEYVIRKTNPYFLQLSGART
ncbi:MAG: chemotaxis protein CheW [Hydrococcus sp. Prado102]|jgi:two-component system chemotaxis sensor kinase CheA|nr:chemotaxis protein CheW [Hydrococcus sp. Prado102]